MGSFQVSDSAAATVFMSSKIDFLNYKLREEPISPAFVFHLK